MNKEYIERESLLDGILSSESGIDDIIQDLIMKYNLDFLHDTDEDSVREFAKDLIINIKNYISTEPIVDVVPVIHGRWLDEDSFDFHGSPIYRCSVCNKTVADNYISCHKYCLHCGAKMNGGGSNE